MIRVDIVSDVVCPWCVVGWRQLARAAADTGVALDPHWRPFQLNPQTPEAGTNLRAHLMAKYGMTRAQSEANRQRLSAIAAEVGFAFDWFDEMTTQNTLRAHQLLHWAEALGRGHALKQELFAVYFTRRGDVNDPDTLAAAAAAAGLDPAEAAAVLAEDRHADAVRAEMDYWRRQGVDGVPAMIFERRHLVSGAQGVETFARILTHLSEAAQGGVAGGAVTRR